MCRGPTSRSHHVTLLVPPSAYNTQYVTERSYSVPTVKQNNAVVFDRPNTSPSDKPTQDFVRYGPDSFPFSNSCITNKRIMEFNRICSAKTKLGKMTSFFQH